MKKLILALAVVPLICGLSLLPCGQQATAAEKAAPAAEKKAPDQKPAEKKDSDAKADEKKAPDKPIQLKSASSKKMWVTFNHGSHQDIDCEVCHHMTPSDAKSPFVSCGASDECHNIKNSKERDPQSLFWAYHTKSAEHSCYGCHHVMVNEGCRPCHMSPQARAAAGQKAQPQDVKAEKKADKKHKSK